MEVWGAARRRFLLGGGLAGWTGAALGAVPAASGTEPGRPATTDTPYPGVIRLTVDATDTERGIFRVREHLPVPRPGPLVLLYPQWIPGKHWPAGPISGLAGLTIRAGDAPVPWRRDPGDLYAFHLAVPDGAAALELEFQFLSPLEEKQGTVVMTPEMLCLRWNTVVLYPAGYADRHITVAASLRLPNGWQHGTALEATGSDRGDVAFAPVSLETLVDSPVLAGRHAARVDLDPGGPVPVWLHACADRPEHLAAEPAQVEAHRALVQQAYRLFGARHFDRYHFLLGLTDGLTQEGLEHHRSSENLTTPDYFRAWDKSVARRDLLPHELCHSWNGKFRRPAELLAPDLNTPTRNTLLWIYEGLTQYWGQVLAARAGLRSQQEALDAFAELAARMDTRAGRGWRSLLDTTHDPILAARQPLPWTSWQRSEDYYDEGALLWLEVDTLLRELSGEARSLDDFARAFFGVEDGRVEPLPYGFAEVAAALDGVQRHDWAGFLRQRVTEHAAGAPLEGLRRGGYDLAYAETPSAYFRSGEETWKETDLRHSLGLVLDEEGNITGVVWDGVAFRAGLVGGMKVVAVGGVAYEADRLRAAVTAAKAGTGPVEVLVKRGERFRTARLEYAGGLRYPYLRRREGMPARLDTILAAR